MSTGGATGDRGWFAPPRRPDPRLYAYAEALDRRGWAWEFLRRNPEFGGDWRELRAGAALEGAVVRFRPEEQRLLGRWGLLFQ